jgi:hypothetical protein
VKVARAKAAIRRRIQAEREKQKPRIARGQEFVRDVRDGFIHDAKETAVGLKDAGVGVWKMTGGAAFDPKEAARLWKMAGQVAVAAVKHPTLIPKALVAPYVDAFKSGHPGDAVGRAAFEILAALSVSEVMAQFSTSLAGAGHIINAAANSADDIARATARLGFIAEEVGAHEEEVEGEEKMETPAAGPAEKP